MKRVICSRQNSRQQGPLSAEDICYAFIYSRCPYDWDEATEFLEMNGLSETTTPLKLLKYLPEDYKEYNGRDMENILDLDSVCEYYDNDEDKVQSYLSKCLKIPKDQIYL